MTGAAVETIWLEGNLSIRDAARIRETLQVALAASSSRVLLDCAGLIGVDVAILQLLVAANKSAIAEGKSLHLLGTANGPLRTLLQQTGFLGPDGKPKAPHASFWAGAEQEAA